MINDAERSSNVLITLLVFLTRQSLFKDWRDKECVSLSVDLLRGWKWCPYRCRFDSGTLSGWWNTLVEWINKLKGMSRSSKNSLELDDAYAGIVPDDELSSLNIKDLNRKLKEKGLSKDTIEKLKQRRRTLKNRRYATEWVLSKAW